MSYKYYLKAFKTSAKAFFKWPLKILAIACIKYLQKQYRLITINNCYNQNTNVLSKLKLIQHILYFFKTHFSAWGYFHPGPLWNKEDQKYYDKLFPQKDFDELPLVVYHNPAAITYYHNKIYILKNKQQVAYADEIKKQLLKWNEWN
jgi:hypothetical protein